ncbi:MAG: sulfotransferase family protein, partial [Gemmatimonadales bacterium]
RSGTTLLRLMLDNHPDVAIPLDTVGLWSAYAGKLGDYGNLAEPAGRERLIDDLLKEERIRLWEANLTPEIVLNALEGEGFPAVVAAFHSAYAASRGKKRWGDKDPGNMHRIQVLNAWFPDARFIHIIRDGRDACLSHLKQSFGYGDVLECAAGWQEEVQWVRRMGEILGERYLELRYEDLVKEPEPVLRRLCTFLGITYDPQMLKYHERVSRSVPEEKRHIWPLLSKPPQHENLDRWRKEMSAGQRVAFEKRAGGMLRAMGYETYTRYPTRGTGEEVMSFARRVLGAFWRRGKS